jgi:hypothetical protein
MKISKYLRHPKTVSTAMKAIPKTFPTAAQEQYFKGYPSQYAAHIQVCLQ